MFRYNDPDKIFNNVKKITELLRHRINVIDIVIPRDAKCGELASSLIFTFRKEKIM